MTDMCDDTADAVRQAWTAAIGLGEPPPDDVTFRDLGGTSVQAAVTLASLWRRFGVRLRLSDLRPDDCVASLSARLDERRTAAAAGEEIP